jgi:hypothetical protein
VAWFSSHMMASGASDSPRPLSIVSRGALSATKTAGRFPGSPTPVLSHVLRHSARSVSSAGVRLSQRHVRASRGPRSGCQSASLAGLFCRRVRPLRGAPAATRRDPLGQREAPGDGAPGAGVGRSVPQFA